jgi:hypothetical protein
MPKVRKIICALCDTGFLSFLDGSLNTETFGGFKIPGRLIARWREDHNVAGGKFQNRYKSLAHGETKVAVCSFCYQFFSSQQPRPRVNQQDVRKKEKLNAEVPSKRLKRGDRHSYFCAEDAMRNFSLSIEQMHCLRTKGEENGEEDDRNTARGSATERQFYNKSNEDCQIYLQLNELRQKSKLAYLGNKFVQQSVTSFENSVGDKIKKLSPRPAYRVQLSPQRPSTAPSSRSRSYRSQQHRRMKQENNAFIVEGDLQNRKSMVEIDSVASIQRRKEIDAAVEKQLVERQSSSTQRRKKRAYKSPFDRSMHSMNRAYSKPCRFCILKCSVVECNLPGYTFDLTCNSRLCERQNNLINLKVKKRIELMEKQRRVTIIRSRLKQKKWGIAVPDISLRENRSATKNIMFKDVFINETYPCDHGARLRSQLRDIKKSKSSCTTAANRYGKTERVQDPFRVNPMEAVEYLRYFGKRKRFSVFFAILKQCRNHPFVLHQAFLLLLPTINSEEGGKLGETILSKGIVDILKSCLLDFKPGCHECREAALEIVSALSPWHVEILFKESFLEAAVKNLEHVLNESTGCVHDIYAQQYLVVIQTVVALLKCNYLQSVETKKKPENFLDPVSNNCALKAVIVKLQILVRKGVDIFCGIRHVQKSKECLTWLEIYSNNHGSDFVRTLCNLYLNGPRHNKKS